MSVFSSNDEHFCTPFALHNKSNTSAGQIERTRLEPENDYGNVEYKLRLTNPTSDRVERLVTQLKWRIREGQGEAILYLGVRDDGTFVGLTPDEFELSMQTLERMSAKIGAKMVVVSEIPVENNNLNEDHDSQRTEIRNKKFRNRPSSGSNFKENTYDCRVNKTEVDDDATRSKEGSSNYNAQKNPQLHRKVIQVLVKRKTHDISEELRVAVLGPTESGKSSLLGVLSHGECDNGRGSARLNLFRHRHEVRSGHTSCISQEIFGLSSHGQPLTYSTCLSPEEIIESSTRIVTLIDLAGHQRYMSTTLFGLGSHSPDIILIVVSVTSAISRSTIDHISLALELGQTTAVVINKTDLVNTDDQESCYNDILRSLRVAHPDVDPLRVLSLNDVSVASKNHGLLPFFFTSCVSGSGLNFLYAFFNEVAPKLNSCDPSHATCQPSELQVDETFRVPGIGTVVSGLMIEGIIREGDEMLLGPDDHGLFSPVSIVSLQRHKIPCNLARAGQKCTLAIIANDLRVRRGMVMKEFDSDWTQSFSVCLDFDARIRFINTNKQRLCEGSQVSVYIGNVRQTCLIRLLKQVGNDTFLICLKFTRQPEYVRKGSRLIMRHASTIGIGIVTDVKLLYLSDLTG